MPRILCHNSAHLDDFVGGVIEHGGEGMIVRKVGSPYLHGRNSSLIKLKVLMSPPPLTLSTILIFCTDYIRGQRGPRSRIGLRLRDS